MRLATFIDRQCNILIRASADLVYLLPVGELIDRTSEISIWKYDDCSVNLFGSISLRSQAI